MTANGYSMTTQLARQAEQHIRQINSALDNAGLHQIPGPDLTGLPEVTAPTSDEITTAIRKAKGPLEKDPGLEALATRAWIAQQNPTGHLRAQAWIDAWEAFKATRGDLITQLRDQYQEAGDALAQVVSGPLGDHPSLDEVDLSQVSTPHAHAAADAINHLRRARATHAAWRAIHAALEGGRKAHWDEQATPTYEQYRAAHDAAPQTFPKPDAWAIARAGWKLELAASFTDAQNRRNALREQSQNDRDAARTVALRSTLASGGLLKR